MEQIVGLMRNKEICQKPNNIMKKIYCSIIRSNLRNYTLVFVKTFKDSTLNIHLKKNNGEKLDRPLERWLNPSLTMSLMAKINIK